MIILILGKQKPDRNKPVNNAAKLGQTTREIMKAESLRKSLGGKVSKKVRYLICVSEVFLLLSVVIISNNFRFNIKLSELLVFTIATILL